MQAHVFNRQDAFNAADMGTLASFYAADAVLMDLNANERFAGSRAIADYLTGISLQGGKYRADGAPVVVGDRYVVVPFSLVDQKDLTDRTGGAGFVNVLEIRDGKILREWASGTY